MDSLVKPGNDSATQFFFIYLHLRVVCLPARRWFTAFVKPERTGIIGLAVPTDFTHTPCMALDENGFSCSFDEIPPALARIVRNVWSWIFPCAHSATQQFNSRLIQGLQFLGNPRESSGIHVKGDCLIPSALFRLILALRYIGWPSADA